MHICIHIHIYRIGRMGAQLATGTIHRHSGSQSCGLKGTLEKECGYLDGNSQVTLKTSVSRGCKDIKESQQEELGG